MAISPEEIKHVAFLARLELTETETELFTEQLNSVLDHATILERVDTDNVQPTVYTFSPQNVLREDRLGERFEREKALQNAPDGDDGFFRVPKIV